MAGEIQPAPPGLLSLLALKAQGENPNRLSDTVVPTMDVTHWYGQDSIEVVNGSQFIADNVIYANADGFLTAPLIVPLGELWYVHDYAVWLNMTAAPGLTAVAIQALQAYVRWPELDPGAGLGYMLGESAPRYDDTLAGVPQFGTQFYSPSIRGFWARQYTEFGYYFAGAYQDGGSATGVMRGHASITRLKL